jgi:WD40 repeat protein
MKSGRLVVVGLVALGAVMAWAAGPPPAPPREVPGLIGQLDDEDRDTRRGAMKELEAIGEAALPALRRAGRDHADPDVRLRALVVASAVEGKICGERRRYSEPGDSPGQLALSPDAKLVATCGWIDKKDLHYIRVWELGTGKTIRWLTGHTAYAWALAFLPDGKHFLAGCNHRSVHLWNIQTGKEVWKTTAHPGQVHWVAVSRDGKTAVTTGGDNTPRVWDVAKGEVVRKLVGHTRPARSVVFVPGNRRCVSASFDGTVRLWDVATGKELARHKHTWEVYSAAATPDGKEVAFGDERGVLQFWDWKDGKVRAAEVRHPYGIANIAYSPDGRRLLTASHDHTARLWDARTGRLLQSLEGHTYQVYGVAFLPGGKQGLRP